MLDYIYDFAKKLDCDFISLIAVTDNVVVQNFYESLGYIREVGYVKIINKLTKFKYIYCIDCLSFFI